MYYNTQASSSILASRSHEQLRMFAFHVMHMAAVLLERKPNEPETQANIPLHPSCQHHPHAVASASVFSAPAVAQANDLSLASRTSQRVCSIESLYVW